LRIHAVRGVVPPLVAEAIIAVRWPSVAAYMGGQPARLGANIQQAASELLRKAMNLPKLWIVCLALLIALPVAILIAVAAWLLLAPFYFAKILPVFMRRYTVTNQRVMIQEGWSLKPGLQVKLDDLREVRSVPGSEQPFYLSADLELLFGEKGSAVLPGVKEYKTFQAAIKNAYLAWGRKNPPKEQQHSAAELAKVK
jgi:hypothetical protein